ncbi:hypothetical protein OSB04_009434 [Centaurea solstitialis]|uniref:Lipid droplet-associated hydrolase n=2 Tax=Asteraceae TaxID=4210 RepID=A0AA38T5L5_9ASTR|nr:hypothetical protein OSB04_009434 [Centaurea solstitialis]
MSAIAKPPYVAIIISSNSLFPSITSFQALHHSNCSQNSSNGSPEITVDPSEIDSRKTELVEIQARNPRLHVLFIPGNPGLVTFYIDFLESLYEQMGETASITGIGHISHSEKDWEHGKLFTLKEQIDHKIDFIHQELQALEVPLVVVGHSIGSYISLEIFKQIPEKVAYLIGLYPFLEVDTESHKQVVIKRVARSDFTSSLISATVALLGFLPIWGSRFIAKMSLAKGWSPTALDALCTSVLKYNTMRNVLYMAMTEFEELVKVPDWEFMREKRNRIAFLFGEDDHWAPLHMYDEIVKQVPDVVVEVEREGLTHAFCCTVAGSIWVARHVATLIKKTIS